VNVKWYAVADNLNVDEIAEELRDINDNTETPCKVALRVDESKPGWWRVWNYAHESAPSEFVKSDGAYFFLPGYGRYFDSESAARSLIDKPEVI
jgi:hypothetical protein